MLRTAAPAVALMLALCGACSAEPTASSAPPAPVAVPLSRQLHAILQTPVAIGRQYVSPPTRTAVQGGRAAIAYGSDLVVVWDLATRREVIRLRPEGEVEVLELSRDGTKLAASGGMKRATLWDVGSGRRITRLPTSGKGLFFNRAGDRLLLVDPSATSLYDLSARRRTIFDASSLPQAEGYNFLGFASDDRTVVALADAYWVRWAAPAAPEAIDVDFSAVLGGLSGDGAQMVAWSWVNSTTKLGVIMDVGAKRQIASWLVPDQPAAGPSFSHDGKRVFMVTDQYTGDQPTSTLLEGLTRPDMRRAWSMSLPYEEAAAAVLGIADGFITVRTPHEILVIRDDGTVELPRGRDRSHLPFVGKWRVHGLSMTIGPDLRGTQVWNAGPCPAGNGMCAGHAELIFRMDPQGLIGTVSTVVYKDEAGRVVAGHPEPRQGDSFVLERVDTGVLRKRSPTGEGNPHLCGSGAQAKWRTECDI
ncbi:hypothetical protein [Streptosporangium sp. NPDC023615]|uniref:hypothetical protein n=1 Tax=Streptosporangium sp. NPDC023615 TaxID=3154794 RepID=UPI00343733D9